ncbi:MAG: DUF7470 family protein [Armatimonadota bacterium]
MKLGELGVVLGLLVCCALLPVLLAGGIGAVTGVLIGSPALVGSGLVLVLVGLVLWIRGLKSKRATPPRQ